MNIVQYTCSVQAYARLEVCSSAQHCIYCSIRFPSLSSGSMVYHPYTMWFPCFICFIYFPFLEEELSFNYDSSSSFLTLNMKSVSYFLYRSYFFQCFIFCDFFSCDFFSIHPIYMYCSSKCPACTSPVSL